MRILHLEDDSLDAELVRHALVRSGLNCEIDVVCDPDAYLCALGTRPYDVVLSDGKIPGYDANAALVAARKAAPRAAFIFVSNHLDPHAISAGAATVARVGKDELPRLREVIERTLAAVAAPAPLPTHCAPQDPHSHLRGMEYLVSVVQQLSLARTVAEVIALVRHAARELVGADGATFVLREGDQCFYADEEAIEPLWKGRRFPMSACISGWAMLNRQAVVIEDIYQDARIPHEAYRPTFVRSLVMTPIRTAAPVGAIGVYWATPHRASSQQTALLVALADSTSVAMESASILTMLEQRIAERTQELQSRSIELELLNRELEAFSYSAAHDLRAPLGVIETLSRAILANPTSDDAHKSVEHIQGTARRMQRLIDDLLGLASVARSPLTRDPVDLSIIAHEILQRLRAKEPARAVEAIIGEGLEADGDPGLLRIMLENLLANAWKFTSKAASPRIELGTERDSDGRTSFYVRDNGAGFDMRYATRLFGPFQRLHSESEFSGTGIGLATVRRIVHRHGGEIRATGEVGRGACFHFTLPSHR